MSLTSTVDGPPWTQFLTALFIRASLKAGGFDPPRLKEDTG